MRLHRVSAHDSASAAAGTEADAPPDSAADRAISTASAGRVKVHRFEPSGRSIMTVVGKGDEHWVDSGMGFCSCRAFYFAMTRGGNPSCYHIKSARVALDSGKAEVIVFGDEEFDDFVRGLVPEL